MQSATVKFGEDSPIAAWLADMRAQGIEQSRAIRCALEAYLSEHGNNPPPPPTPASPAPGGGINVTVNLDAATLAAGFVEAFKQLNEQGYDFTVGVPLNGKNGKCKKKKTDDNTPEPGMIATIGADGKTVMVPKRTDYDPLAEALGGFDDLARSVR